MREKPLAKADVLLQPQRIAILRALGSQSLTPKQLAEVLPTLPHATLYRHLAALHEAGIIAVVDERPVRGAIERTYSLAAGAGILGADDLATATRDDHFRYFATFVAGLLGEFGHYLERPEVDLLADGVGYRELVLNLTDDELRELLAELRAVLDAHRHHPRSTDRTPRLIGTITMPVDRPNGNA
ncbi:helix-turn-helix domain-containing protein [Agromyces sp. Marseille-P2726]|uniref:helix-turn-helix domain-containing protein n=1 Tax=Agromyces sp. Marseille-P2726 TaxID=2709132 RepID=UPI00156F20EE|nr:helix-turn-helix domain-containing protein [Agromyces sp. Marseille-P2726]